MNVNIECLFETQMRKRIFEGTDVLMCTALLYSTNEGF